jgi:voltage-gated potassium channel
VLTLVLVIWGVAIFLYVFGIVIELTVSGTVTGAWAQRRRARRVNELRDHVIICGYGRVGRRAGEELQEAGTPYVVLDFGDDAIAAAQARGSLFVRGSGTEDEHLEAAGLHRAAALLASSDSDADNLYITLSARAARPDLVIVARASDEDAAKKLRLAGADRVVLPYSSAGREMANFALKPQVAAFLDLVSTSGGPEFRLEEIEVPPGWPHSGSSIRELRVRDRTGAMIVALRKADGTFDTTPAPDATLDPGDVLIGVGTNTELAALEELFSHSPR